MKTRRIPARLLALALALPLIAAADSPRDPPHDHLPGKGRLFLVLRMADELDLSDEKALAVSHLIEQAQGKREDLRNTRRDLDRQIREGLAQQKPDQAALAKLVDQAAELDRRQARANEESFTALKKVLTIEQQAKLVLLHWRMHRETRFHGGRWRDRDTEDGPQSPRMDGGGPDHDDPREDGAPAPDGPTPDAEE